MDTSVVRTATWVYTAPESGNYRVFARWPAGEGQANAKYTVQHSGGSATVTMNQGQGGGQWNELGTFAFAGGQDYAVSLSDDANGIVVADAVYIVKVEDLTDAVTWVPNLPASGTYQVYAKWTADETRATDARYSIVHEGGTAEVSVNQRAAGGLWQYLGSYAFDPLSSPTVTLAANDNGSVAADAIRVVGGPGGATDIAYVHSDHLGTPQAMTDANAQILWWRDQTPFGQTVAEGGFSVSPLRFPGQYADTESGLAYNYFRDYDPALGRYIQSDPIGLDGGLNTYGYVGGNPLGSIDPMGLAQSGQTKKVPGTNTTVRIDPPHYEGQQRHAHVCGKGCKEIVVNADGSGSHGTDPSKIKNKKVLKYLAKKGIRVVLKCAAPIFFVYDWSTDSFGRAVDELTWPASELWSDE